jgi:hypothetical protein
MLHPKWWTRGGTDRGGENKTYEKATFYQRVAFEMRKDSALTLGMHVVVNVVNTRILLQFVFHSLPFATFVFSPWHF